MRTTVTAQRLAQTAVLTALVAAGVLATGPQPAARAGTRARPVLVTDDRGAAAARGQVEAAGGRVLQVLPLASGVIATLPAGAALAGARVVPDAVLRPAGDSGADASPPDSPPDSTTRATLGLPPTGQEGAGITVALVDTGVADMPALTGQVTHVNVSGGPAGDGYGHGTFLAGLITGTATTGSGTLIPVAPGARVLDVQVAGADGGTTLARVAAGLQQVADAASHDRSVRVLNLSLSLDSDAPRAAVELLEQMLDRLWSRGIVVVVPAGNAGPAAGSVTAPGTDQTLLTVGAVDEQGTADRADDTIAPWSGRGGGGTPGKPDVAAPGAHLTSVRDPGSAVDTAHPQAAVGAALFRGSGTSMATAVVAGAVADILAADSWLTPDQVKADLAATAYTAPGLGDNQAAGAGGVDLARARSAPVPDAAVDGPGREPQAAPDTPAGTRAADDTVGRAGGQAWSGQAWSGQAWGAQAWAAQAWAAQAWSGQAWSAQAWSAQAWSAQAWSDASWGA